MAKCKKAGSKRLRDSEAEDRKKKSNKIVVSADGRGVMVNGETISMDIPASSSNNYNIPGRSSPQL